ncbi:hypothetical protein A9165_10710 [Alishewanella sp. HH-ZS]|nr:hypothetical protein A9165_10710 [Alishewanella sp. HH-ZS]
MNSESEDCMRLLLIYMLLAFSSLSRADSFELVNLQNALNEYNDWRKSAWFPRKLTLYEHYLHFKNGLHRDKAVASANEQIRWLFVQELERLWRQEHPLYNHDRYKLMSEASFRLDVAFHLANAEKAWGCPINISKVKLRDYAIQYKDTQDVGLKVDVIRTLGQVGTTSDIDYFVNIVRHEQDGLAQNAIKALRGLHQDEAMLVLLKLRGEQHSPAVQAFLEEVIGPFTQGGGLDHRKIDRCPR